VEHVKKLNKGLENKIISLQQKIEELVSDLSFSLYCLVVHSMCVTSSKHSCVYGTV
jgi:hypothetical protein